MNLKKGVKRTNYFARHSRININLHANIYPFRIEKREQKKILHLNYAIFHKDLYLVHLKSSLTSQQKKKGTLFNPSTEEKRKMELNNK